MEEIIIGSPFFIRIRPLHFEERLPSMMVSITLAYEAGSSQGRMSMVEAWISCDGFDAFVQDLRKVGSGTVASLDDLSSRFNLSVSRPEMGDPRCEVAMRSASPEGYVAEFSWRGRLELDAFHALVGAFENFPRWW